MNHQDAQVARAVRSVIPDCLQAPEPWTLKITDPSLAKVVRAWIELGFKAHEAKTRTRLPPLRPDLHKYVTGLDLLASGDLSEVVTEVVTEVVGGRLDDIVERVEMLGVTAAARLADVPRQAIQKRIDGGTLPASRDDLGRWRVSRADVLAIDWKPKLR